MIRWDINMARWHEIVKDTVIITIVIHKLKTSKREGFKKRRRMPAKRRREHSLTATTHAKSNMAVNF